MANKTTLARPFPPPLVTLQPFLLRRRPRLGERRGNLAPRPDRAQLPNGFPIVARSVDLQVLEKMRVKGE